MSRLDDPEAAALERVLKFGRVSCQPPDVSALDGAEAAALERVLA